MISLIKHDIVVFVWLLKFMCVFWIFIMIFCLFDAYLPLCSTTVCLVNACMNVCMYVFMYVRHKILSQSVSQVYSPLCCVHAVPWWADASVLVMWPSRPRDRLHANKSSIRPSLDACRSRPPGEPRRLAEWVFWQGIMDGDYGAMGTDSRLRQSTVCSLLLYIHSCYWH